ncbi:magnesium transporter MgtE [bacterium BMS3Abin05]|nr:magnesium transporter MgtE [bacterium BMS3Abin05]
MITKLILPEIEDLIKEKRWNTIKEILSNLETADIAELLKNLDEKEAVLVFRLLPQRLSSDVFPELETSIQKNLLSHILDSSIQALINDLSPDDRTDLLEELPGQITQKLLNLLTIEQRKEALELLGYPENSAGRLMTPDYVAVHQNWSIEKALNHIRARGKDAETIDMIYVVAENWKLIDDIPIRRFILAKSSQSVYEIMDHKFIAIRVDEDQENAYHLMKKYNLTVLPVTNKEGILLGIITVDDVLDVVEEEVTEDFQKVSAVSPVEKSYSLASPYLLYRKRIGWLMLLLIADFFSSSIIAHFQNALQTVIALAFFIPVLIDSGGNIAAQSSTLVIRALATGDLSVKRWFSTIQKELYVGLMLGISLGVILYVRGFFWRGGPLVGLIVAVTMVLITLWANILGSLLPIILTRFKLDPAVISSPLLTTVVDSTGLLIYFNLAQFMFHLT